MHHGVVRIGSWFGYIAPYYAPRVDGKSHHEDSLSNTTPGDGKSLVVVNCEFEKKEYVALSTTWEIHSCFGTHALKLHVHVIN